MIARFAAGRLKGARGGSLIEFMFVALTMLMVSLGLVEFSRMVLVYTAISNSARAGARYAASHGHGRSGGSGANGESGPGNNPPEVLLMVENVASAGLVTLSDSDITVTYSPSNTPGSTVTVRVVHTYSALIPYFNFLQPSLASISQAVITF